MEHFIKNLVHISLAFVFLPGILASCTHAQRTINLSTDEAVLERLAKQTNKKFSKNNTCIQRVKELGEVIVIGSFRYDYGCHFEGVFVKTVYLEDRADLSKNALTLLGWEKWNRELREKTTLAWVEKVLLAFSEVLYTRDKDFKGDEFSPPQVVTTTDGEIIISLWTSVMRRKKEFQRHEFRFTKDGDLLHD